MDLTKASLENLRNELKRREECEHKPRKDIILLGPPGSGKGTQANKITDEFCFCQLSTGDLLRDSIAQKDPEGLKAKEAMDKGLLVSDDIVNSLLMKALESPKCARGVIFDGYPRNQHQAETLDEILTKEGRHLNKVIELKVDEEKLYERIEGRRVHPSSGRSYHIKFNPPKEEGKDDVTGEPLIQRSDSKREVVKSRLDVYNQKTAPVINYYKQKGMLTSFDAMEPIDIVYEKIKKTLLH